MEPLASNDIRPLPARRKYGLAALTLVSAMLASPPAAKALDTDDPPCDPGISARVLIQRGHDHSRAGNEGAALAAYRCAFRKDPTPESLTQIALAEQALGQWVAAERDLRSALADRHNPWIAKRRAMLEEDLHRIGDNLADLMVAGKPEGASLRIDGRRVGTLPLREPLRVPTGTVEIEVSAPGFTPVRRARRLESRAYAMEQVELVPVAEIANVKELTLPAVVSDPAPGDEGKASAATAPLVPAGAPAPDAPSSDGWKRPMAWSILAAAGLALGGGVAFTVLLSSRASDFNKEGNGCGEQQPSRGVAGCADLYDRIQSAQMLAIAGYSAAAVFGGLSLVLFMSSARASSPSPGLAITCLPSGNALGVACLGRF